MGFENTSTEYGIISKLFHWSMALIIMGLLVLGFYMVSLDSTPFKFELYGWHKSFGALILFMVIARILWKFFNIKPERLATHKKWEKILAKIAHVALATGMICMPLSGWMMSSSGGHAVKMFGLELPAIVDKSKLINGWMSDLHEFFGYVLIIAILFHVAGALKHHFIDGDMTLKRMLTVPLQSVGPYIAVFIAGLFFAAVAYFILLN